MTTLPLHAIPVVLDGQICLRIYAGRDLEVDMPCGRARRWCWRRSC